MGYAATTTTIDRSREFDLGLSPRELARYPQDIWAAIQQMVGGKRIEPSLATEVSAAVQLRAGLGAPRDKTLAISTLAPICRPGRLDLRKANERMLREIGRRDAYVADNASGGYMVATDNVGFIELLRNRMVAFTMGATRLSGLTGNVTVPKLSASSTAYWLSSESSTITESNVTFGQVPLTPRTVGAYTEISRLLQIQSSPDAQQLILSDLAKQVAVATDLAALAGTGTEQPTGILGTANVGTFSGTSLGLTGLLDAQADVANANALTPNCGYVFTPTDAALLMTRQQFAGPTGAALWQGNLNDGEILGFKAMSSAQMPTGKGIFGNFADLLIAEWGVLELSVSNAPTASAFQAGITGLRCMFTCDIGVRHAASFSITSSIT